MLPHTGIFCEVIWLIHYCTAVLVQWSRQNLRRHDRPILGLLLQCVNARWVFVDLRKLTPRDEDTGSINLLEFGRRFAQQPTGHDQQLNLLGAFEDVQNFCIPRPFFQ